MAGERRGQHADGVGHDVGHGQVAGHGLAFAQVALHGAHAVLHMIQSDIFTRHLDRCGVDIDGQHLSGAQTRRRDGQNAAAGAHIHDAHIAFEVLFEQLHAHVGRLVRAGAKRHAGVQLNDQVLRHGLIRLPGGLDHQMRADTEGLIILFPVFGPVLVLDAA